MSAAARLVLLAAAEAAGWPAVRLGREVLAGETRWRQRATLADADELAALRAALAGRVGYDLRSTEARALAEGRGR